MFRCGRRCFEELQIEVLSAGLSYDWGQDTSPWQNKLASALAEQLGIAPEEAMLLTDVEPEELTGHSGEMTYGYLFDFSEAAPPLLASKLLKKHGSLQLEVGPWFFDALNGPDVQA